MPWEDHVLRNSMKGPVYSSLMVPAAMSKPRKPITRKDLLGQLRCGLAMAVDTVRDAKNSATTVDDAIHDELVEIVAALSRLKHAAKTLEG
jgi:hypothetical protein